MKQIIMAGIVVLSGCASSGVVPIGQDTYMITKQSAGGMFVSPGSIKVEIFREAQSFCQSEGKIFQVVGTNELASFPGRLPSAEVQFMCLNKGDREVARPKLHKTADTVIEVRK